MFTSATFEFIGFDNATAVTFECRLDSTDAGAWAPCTSPATYHGLSLTEHAFEVRAVDVSGNIDPTPASATWTIIAPQPGVAPDTTIDSSPDATTVDTSAVFTFSANEPGATFECRLDSTLQGDFVACTSPTTYNGLAPGLHTFDVRAVDTESLPDPTPASFSWTVGAPPVATAVSCGQTITQSIRVTNDLVDCPANGLVVGANGITIDLDGHTIDGLGLGAGIANPSFDSVAIINGVVQEFDVGVQLGAGVLAERHLRHQRGRQPGRRHPARRRRRHDRARQQPRRQRRGHRPAQRRRRQHVARQHRRCQLARRHLGARLDGQPDPRQHGERVERSRHLADDGERHRSSTATCSTGTPAPACSSSPRPVSR